MGGIKGGFAYKELDAVPATNTTVSGRPSCLFLKRSRTNKSLNNARAGV